MVLFKDAFKALTGYAPFRWQERLYERLVARNAPDCCNLPTGLGKTSIIHIWLIALAAAPTRVPRRLVYVVNRRTVVDQATREVERLRENLGSIPALAEPLMTLCAAAADPPLAISTLRGQLADNEEWKADPARPAIIVGTIDMIGSKLLFSGYGDGRYNRAHHAGLVGQDVLVVHDEAHLTPAFSDLLHGIAQSQSQAGEPRPVEVMELSATLRDHNANVFTLEAEDEEDRIVQERLGAEKRLYRHPVKQEGVIAKLIELAKAHEKAPSKVLVYVRSPEEALEVARNLKNDNGRGDRVALLTGTIRGHERDKLVKQNRVYQALLNPGPPVEQTVYLVSTSAGEVGIDIDADHLVCDLATLDSMVQRLGRVNRRGGENRIARVDVVVQSPEPGSGDKVSEFDQAVLTTQKILSRWTKASSDGVDVSPRNLRSLIEGLKEDEKTKAFSPKPQVPPLTDILLDAWSLTSITAPTPGRPEVAAYLHGLTNDPPETFVVWRKEVSLFSKACLDAQTLCDWFHTCRIEARERLRDRTDRVKKALGVLLKTHRGKDDNRDFPVVLLNERGEAKWSTLSSIVQEDSSLAYRTVVLPVEAGGLTDEGMLDGKTVEPAEDVADTAAAEHDENRRERWLCIQDEEGQRYERLITGQAADLPPQGLRESERVALARPLEGAEGEGESRYLLLVVGPKQTARDDPESTTANQALGSHWGKVVEQVNRIAEALGLHPALKEALCQAAKWHDCGKARRIWQRFACNPNSDKPLAKSNKYLSGRVLGGYRHEFGAMLEAAKENEMQDHPEADLILHLIAAHHGWARPHFEPRAFDHERFSTSENQQAAAEVMRRFGRLQQRFGRWGLAWLESLLRCADIAASRSAEEQESQEAQA